MHATVQRREGDQEQAEQVKPQGVASQGVASLYLLFANSIFPPILLLVLLQHISSFVFLLSVHFCIFPGGEFMGWTRRKLLSWES